MTKMEFKAESKRLLDLMIHSIYTHKEIFLRELISNSSDAIDKLYYKAIKDKSIELDKEDLFIKLFIDKENRLLRLVDKGIGMTRVELEENLGTIAKSGSFAFKNENETIEDLDIIGQFGIGFYSAFMVADLVTVKSRAYGSDKAYIWESDGLDGFVINETIKEEIGTEIIMKIKENSKEENYDDFLEEYRLKNIIKKYSNFIRYPIKMDVAKSKLKENSEDEYEEYWEEEIINSMVPIWRKNKNELKEEDYENFYQEKHFGFDKPVKHIHLSMDGLVSYNSIIFIPRNAPYDFYTQEYEKGLELYSSGVLIMEKCPDLLPDYFSFVKGVVDSEDLSLNISREILQHDRQLKLMAKKIEEKIKEELESLLNKNRDEYEEFYESFGKQLKYGIYSDFGMNKEVLQDLILFYSSKKKAMVTLKEYISSMNEEQKYIYYASGESIDRIDKSPQIELLKDKDYEILYLLDEIDEFAIKMLNKYEDIEFKSANSEDLGIEDEDKEELEEEAHENKDLFTSMREYLEGKIEDVRPSKRLKNHPVCLSSKGELSIEMEKVLKSMPNNPDLQAEKVLEINIHHSIFENLKEAYNENREKFELYTKLLYDQALLIEGLPIEDPVEFSNNICKLM